MSINFFAIILATIISFGLGSLWFSKLFGKTWMKIHHADPKEMSMSMKSMWKFFLTEFVLTFIINFFLYIVIMQSTSLMFASVTVLLLWLGFILPTITSSVLWGNDNKKYMVKKIALSSVFRLLAMLLSVCVFFLWR